jgi:hypothetical protein
VLWAGTTAGPRGEEETTRLVVVESKIQLAHVLECTIQALYEDLRVVSTGHVSATTMYRLTCIKSRMPSSDSAPSTTNLSDSAPPEIRRLIPSQSRSFNMDRGADRVSLTQSTASHSADKSPSYRPLSSQRHLQPVPCLSSPQSRFHFR